ncbi:MAG TPA: HAD family hydrolase [Mobilitalea sp.]|nr:HAD family hydrolase [Mobilitalea sp.]
MQNIKAVIFDIDETLINRKEAFLRLCDYLIDKYAKDYPFEGSKEELINYLVEIDANGYGGLNLIIPKLSRVWKLPHTTQEFIEERNSIFGKLTTTFPETYEVLDKLKGKYKLAVITNGYSSVQREKISTVQLEDYFDDIIVSGEEDFEKPDPRIFWLSCEHLGVKPEEAVFIGDYYPNDIAGALSAKIMPIWISEDPDEHMEYQGIRVKRLKDILEYL